jgi:putative transposase
LVFSALQVHVPRALRQEVEGGVHHVFARGNDRRDLYRDDADRETYLALLGRVVIRQRWRCLAYCLMPNHVHLLIETPEANLGAGMQRLHGLYAHLFNERHGRCGHVFQGRYGSVLLVTDEHLWAVAAYLALNPVRAGLCARPEQWPWGSHAVVHGRRAPRRWLDHARLLRHFEGLGGDPMERYSALVSDDPRHDAGGSVAAATVSRR